ncbi:BglG family transcription antiterminator [Bacillus sp. JCM 19034]|uniref:BglG family transcription antiterminator n=1 Tax=Bacillus sp. JCM 19034 TaxID=1481928 RepID=UPI000AFC182C|nr:PRD domain-containing protein [Bacillus sp. JCM 19034]
MNRIFFIEEKLPNEDEHTSEFQLMKNICNELEKQFSIHLKYQDIAFLTVILRSSKVQAADSIDYDTVLLGKNIKKVIADVSSRLQVHLTDDFSLYQGLLAHMGPSIYRLKQKLDLFNPLTAEIKRKYPVLFIAVKKSLEEVFEDILFPEDEIAFIVLHFGSSLLKNEEKVKMNAVVVCPTGIGASKMVASRLKKELSEINDVEIMSIKDFQTANLTEYDLVISTVRLPFAEVDYILVSPLLSDKDIGFIRGYLDKHLEQISQKKEYLNNVQNRNEKATNKHNVLKNMLTEIKDVQLSMESILTNFKVYRKQGSSNCWDVLGEMINDAKKDGLVTDTKKVIEQLERREKQGGFGIPNTNMGLYHCREDHVLELIFQVAHLDRPSVIKGMDGQPMQVKSVLLMLAPEIMSKRKKEILSLISSSLVESDIAMMVFHLQMK